MWHVLTVVFGLWAAAPADQVVRGRALGAVSLEAGIVYRMGGPEPVARVEFRLLRQSLREIATAVHSMPEYEAAIAAERKADAPPSVEELTDGSAAIEYGIYRIMKPFGELVASKPIGTKMRLMEAALEKATVDVVTTGFNGKATFKPVPTGTYFVFGMSELRSGKPTGWCVPVKVVRGNVALILDQNNMLDLPIKE